LTDVYVHAYAYAYVDCAGRCAHAVPCEARAPHVPFVSGRS